MKLFSTSEQYRKRRDIQRAIKHHEIECTTYHIHISYTPEEANFIQRRISWHEGEIAKLYEQLINL